VEDLARVRDRHGARGLDGAERVVSAHVMAMAGDGDHAAGVLRADVATGDADEGGAHLQPGEALRGLDGVRDGLDGPVDVDDDAFAEAVGRRLADADDVDPAASGELADEDADLRRADVDRDEYRLVRHRCLSHFLSPFSPCQRKWLGSLGHYKKCLLMTATFWKIRQPKAKSATR